MGWAGGVGRARCGAAFSLAKMRWPISTMPSCPCSSLCPSLYLGRKAGQADMQVPRAPTKMYTVPSSPTTSLPVLFPYRNCMANPCGVGGTGCDQGLPRKLFMTDAQGT